MGELRKITLYRIKDGLGFSDYLKLDPAKMDSFAGPKGRYEGLIKFDKSGGQKTEEKIPWMVFLNSGFDKKKYSFTSNNVFPRAIMALKIRIGKRDEHFAATFGAHGDTYLKKNVVVADFGIKIGMNICDLDELRRIQTTSHEATTRQTERQSSTGARLDFFDINTEIEFLRAISGSVKDSYRGTIDSFKGRDSITLKIPKDTDLTWDDLVEICEDLEERYKSDDYKKTEFKVYDLFRYETDVSVVAELDTKLCANIARKDFSKIHLAPPIFEPSDEVSFSYAGRDSDGNLPALFGDLRIEELINHPRRRLAGLTPKTMKAWAIYEYNDETDMLKEKWDAYECVVAEVDIGKGTYVLSNGNWREVSQELKDEVTGYLSDPRLIWDAKYLADGVRIWDGKQDRESVYNEAIARTEASVFLLDKAKIDIAGKRAYELCDLLHDSKTFVHVKRFSTGSASISHLFSQARFYSRAFSTDKRTRISMRKWIKDDAVACNAGKNKATFSGLIPEDGQDVKESEFSVLFCILHSGGAIKLTDLPFMAQYELMHAMRFLTEDRHFKAGVLFRGVLQGPPPAP